MACGIGGLHIGGGITDQNALEWLEAGAEKVRPIDIVIELLLITLGKQVIVTSFLFPSCCFSLERLQRISSLVGKDHLVVDVRLVNMELSLYELSQLIFFLRQLPKKRGSLVRRYESMAKHHRHRSQSR